MLHKNFIAGDWVEGTRINRNHALAVANDTEFYTAVKTADTLAG